MGYQNHGFVLKIIKKSLKQCSLRRFVQRRADFVQQQDAPGPQESTGNCNTLCLKDVEDKFSPSAGQAFGELSSLASAEKAAESHGTGGTRERTLPDALAAYERELITGAFRQAGGKIVRAAELLGIPRQTLQRKIKKYQITLD